MTFQWIVNNAETISVNRKKQVSTTTARNGIVRAISRGTQPKRFEVKLPDGLPWSSFRSDILAAEVLDKITSATITLPYARFPWYYNNTAPGSDESYTVLCTDFPEWTIFSRNQVSWSGPFVFQEVV
jgi:hypothetical protein